jgi:hypothetical protein
MATLAALAILAIVYVSWFFYAVYVMGPREYGRNEANYSWSGVIFSSILVLLGVATIVLTRFIWRSIAGQDTATKTIHGLAALVAIIWLPLGLISPSVVIFLFTSVFQLVLHSLFGGRAFRLLDK